MLYYITIDAVKADSEGLHDAYPNYDLVVPCLQTISLRSEL